ncbi:S1/P1 nuclease [Sphingosinithalassobacter sp. CS137]|uniref:S1/P1 nuclease n=1 Tax=Sphingosinithalassobacter sp. CS137 TaxID=2762748 RepID=UPI00165E1D02|nr:S1/P1 nuclease [Sphingosinithalassobacter sp. CS137]
MLRSLFAALTALLLLAPAPAFAWWEYGHQTVAAIAYRNVAPETRAAIDRLLARQALLETPSCPAGTIEEASVWADCIKPLGARFSYAYSWHYQNVNVCQPFDLESACKDGNCVSAQVTRNAALLKDRSVPLRERVMALAFLVHFVGDLHMPLHAGDKGDLGGNRLKTNYGIYSTDRLNLHSVWDGLLAERAISTPPSLVHAYPADERARIAAGSVEDWSRESWEVSRQHAYAAALDGKPCSTDQERGHLSNETIETMVEPAREQIKRAGLRLARLLDEALG